MQPRENVKCEQIWNLLIYFGFAKWFFRYVACVCALSALCMGIRKPVDNNRMEKDLKSFVSVTVQCAQMVWWFCRC